MVYKRSSFWFGSPLVRRVAARGNTCKFADNLGGTMMQLQSRASTSHMALKLYDRKTTSEERYWCSSAMRLA